MKIKNIAFSGFAAMIFAGLCGAADAVSYNLASKSYVDEQLESKANLIDLTELQDTVGKKATQEDLINVATQVNQNTIDIATLMGREHLTADDLTLLRNELQAKINALHESGDYATAASLQAVSESLATLEGNVYTKAEVDAKIAEVASGGNINLDGYAKTSDLDALIELIGANSDRITVLEQAGYQTAGEVSTAIGAATENLASKTELNTKQNVINAENKLSAEYVSGLAPVATTGSYESLTDKPTIPSTDGLATKDELNAKQNVIDAENKLSAEYVSGLATVATSGQYADLQGKPDIPSTDGLATKDELSAKQDVINAENKLSAEYVSGLAPVATTGSYESLTDKPTIPSTDGLVTKDELDDLQTALQAKIDQKQALGDYATAASLQAVSESLATLEGNVYTKAEVDAKIAEVASGGNINLDGYAKTSDLDALELLVNDNTSEISELKAAGYQTAGDVSEAISTATSGLVTSEALDAKGFLDAASITTGTENGTIAVNGTDVPVQGLGSAAYTESSDYLVGPTPKIGTNFLQAVCTNSACTYKFKAYKDIIEEIKADAGIGEI